MEQNAGRRPDLRTADAGYWNGWERTALIGRGWDGLVAPARAGRLARRMRQRLATAESRQQDLARQAMGEPVTGWIKAVPGDRRFLLRALRKVGGEWSLICTAVKLERMHRLCVPPAAA